MTPGRRNADFLRQLGGVLVVAWNPTAGDGRVWWKTPDGAASMDAISVEAIARDGLGMFCAWRETSKLRGSRLSEAEPVVFRLVDAGERLSEWSIEVNTSAAPGVISLLRWFRKARWEFRGTVFATDAEEAKRYAALAGLVFVAPGYVRAIARTLPLSPRTLRGAGS